MIDGHLLRPIDVIEKGETKKIPALKVIVLKLWQQELAGSRRALSVRLKYEAIAQEAAERGIEVELVESDYTRALAGRLSPEGTDNE